MKRSLIVMNVVWFISSEKIEACHKFVGIRRNVLPKA